MTTSVAAVLRLCGAAFVLLLLGGRAMSQTHVVPTAQTLPKVGTRFINTYFVTDSSGRPVARSVADPEMGDDTQFVVKVGVSSHGRKNCMLTTGPGHADTNIYSYAPNGDLYFFNTNHPTWDRLPFGLEKGKVIKTKPIWDTGTVIGRHYEMTVHREYYVVGNDTASFGGKVFHCIKLRLVDVKVWEGQEYLNGTTYWYSPELGYFVRENYGWGGSYFLNQQIADYRPAP